MALFGDGSEILKNRRCQLRNIKKTTNDYNQAEVEAIQNTRLHNRQIVDKWLELGSNRQTVIFCSTIQHCEDVRDAFRDAGVAAESVHGQVGLKERRAILQGFDNSAFPVLCNPMILTEGWDCPVCSCVILLRISSHIPFNTPGKYRWWKGGQSIKETLEELGASEEIMKRYLDQKSGDMKRK